MYIQTNRAKCCILTPLQDRPGPPKVSPKKNVCGLLMREFL